MTSFSLLSRLWTRFQFGFSKRGKDTKRGWMFRGVAKVVFCGFESWRG